MKVCSSCNKHVVADFVEFRSPGESEEKIVRCKNCRETARTYADAAGFVGP